MHTSSSNQLLPALTLAVTALSMTAQATPTLFSTTGAASADIATTLGDFRLAIGGANNGANNALGTLLADGRREINWDAGALPGNMPFNFFNNVSRRGAEFTTPGSGFLVSQNVGAGDPNRFFGDIDASYTTTFTFNSANRLFAANGSTTVDTRFFLPNDPGVAAGVNAFGAVFTDVDLAGVSGIQFYDAFDNLLAEASAPANNGGLSFVGLILDPGVLATRVRLIAGNAPLGAGVVDGSALRTSTADVVAMDDFIYAEPKGLPPTPVPEVGTLASAGALGGFAVLTLLRRRREPETAEGGSLS
jgi:hypothetical protein